MRGTRRRKGTIAGRQRYNANVEAMRCLDVPHESGLPPIFSRGEEAPRVIAIEFAGNRPCDNQLSSGESLIC